MFETAELDRSLSKAEFNEQLEALRVDLLNTQFDLQQANFPVIVVIAGDHTEGCNDLLDRLHEWFDARYLCTHAFSAPSDEEQDRPPMWRYWRVLPASGQLAIFFEAWPDTLMHGVLSGEFDELEMQRSITRIQRFEQTLAQSGALILKFWMHLPRKEYRKRVKQLKRDSERRLMLKYSRWQDENYDRCRRLFERYLRATHFADTPWHIIESTDNRYRNLTAVRMLMGAIQQRLQQPEHPHHGGEPLLLSNNQPTVLDSLDLSLSLEKAEYKSQLKRLQVRLRDLVSQMRRREISCVLVFEGWDAAGKGGAIRRITNAIPAQYYRVVPIAAPNEAERNRHYLWRFWRHIPRAGNMLIFDRSWYGRVLVERVEGFAETHAWQRAYSEINDFEEQLHHAGTPVVKFWLHIDEQEQLARFKARENTAYKKHKITEEDYRNRERWHDYELALHDMVSHTSTEFAHWHLIPANCKRYARVHILQVLCDVFERRLKQQDPKQ